MELCELRAVVHGCEVACDGEDCIYWRALGHIGLEDPEQRGCAIQHFDLLAGDNSAVGEWLLSVKERLEATRPEFCETE